MDEIKRQENSDEPNVIFKAYTDMIRFEIKEKESENIMCVISGYDLDIDFNMDAIKSADDVETCISGLSSLFRDYIMEKLIEIKQTK